VGVLAKLSGDRILLDTRFVDRYLIKQLPGARHDKDTETWSAPLSWATCVALRVLFQGDLELDPALQMWAWEERQAWVDESVRLRALAEPDPAWPTTKSDDGLLPFQEVGVRWLALVERALLAEPMGSGKTVQAIRALRRRAELTAEAVFPALIVCPNGVMLGWEQEWHAWWPEANVTVVTGGMAKRRELLAEDHDVYIINYEGLRGHSRLAGYGSLRLRRCVECDHNLPDDGKHPRHRCERCPKELNQRVFASVVLDEAHRLKDPSSKQTRAAWAVAKPARQVFAMTGTPIASNPGDLWAILHALAPDEHPSREKFIDLYTQTGYTFWGTAEVLGLRPDTRDAFFQAVDPRMRRLPKEVILPQLPPVRRSVRPVSMGAKQARQYREMEKHMAANLEGELLLAVNPLVKLGRLMQLAAATAEIEYTEVVNAETGAAKRVQRVNLIEPSCKLDALEELVEELSGESVVVASASRKLAVLATQRLQRRGVGVGLIAGGMDVYARKAVERDFQAGTIQVIVCVIDAAGEGLTLTRGRTLVYINRHWSHIKNEQMDNRVHRIGSEIHDHVQIIDIVTRDTVEARQREVLAGKAARLEEIVRDRETLLRLLGAAG
jgi:SNF2 family DNA or RNA helicase